MASKPTLPKLSGTPTSRANAAAWNKPGGGYDQWKAGDPAREKAFPVGSPASKALKAGKIEKVKGPKNGK